MQNMINWFEIPAADFNRAVKFYNAVMDTNIEGMEMGGSMMGMFPLAQDAPGVGGAIVSGEMYTPSGDGTKVYLYCPNDLQPFLDRVEPNGGQVIVPKTLITEDIGYFAMFVDTEGNVVALHSYHPDKNVPEMATVADWCEIPAKDFAKSCAFYAKVFGVESLYTQRMGEYDMGFFPMDPEAMGVGGAVVTGEHYNPSGDGSKVYLNCGEDMESFIARIGEAGGTVVVPKTEISPEHGFFAFFKDPEGNIVGLHSMK